MGYVEKILEPGERVVYRAYLHWIVYASPFVLFVAGVGVLASDDNFVAVFIGLLLLLGGLVTFIASWIDRVTTEIAVTTERVIMKWGLIKRDTIEINASKVESMDVRQTILGRLLDYGTVTVRGTGGSFNPLARVAAPLALRRAVGRRQQTIKHP
jgi:uncharacterized membrane protein YdbT with pleckstrin-like domain